MSLAEICDRQNEIIEKQAEIIDDLFLQLLQYENIDEEEKEIDMIQEVAQVR